MLLYMRGSRTLLRNVGMLYDRSVTLASAEVFGLTDQMQNEFA